MLLASKVFKIDSKRVTRFEGPQFLADRVVYLFSAVGGQIEDENGEK